MVARDSAQRSDSDVGSRQSGMEQHEVDIRKTQVSGMKESEPCTCRAGYDGDSSSRATARQRQSGPSRLAGFYPILCCCSDEVGKRVSNRCTSSILLINQPNSVILSFCSLFTRFHVTLTFQTYASCLVQIDTRLCDAISIIFQYPHVHNDEPRSAS